MILLETKKTIFCSSDGLTTIAITMASNVRGVKLVRKFQRYSRTDKKVISVPDTVSQYNKYMGYTDQMGQSVNAYRIGIRGK